MTKVRRVDDVIVCWQIVSGSPASV